jgi:hypothetical protein
MTGIGFSFEYDFPIPATLLLLADTSGIYIKKGIEFTICLALAFVHESDNNNKNYYFFGTCLE